jgi:hypothetical protein
VLPEVPVVPVVDAVVSELPVALDVPEFEAVVSELPVELEVEPVVSELPVVLGILLLFIKDGGICALLACSSAMSSMLSLLASAVVQSC